MTTHARSTGRLLVLSLSLVTAAGSLNCGSDEERPPPYTRPPPDDLRGCVELRTSGTLLGNEFHIDGRRANCAAENLECTLEGTAEVLGQCDGGIRSAICRDMIWRFRCAATGDAGTDGSP